MRQLLAGGAAMVVVGGAWPLLVALTPASDRPWISGTSDNSIWSLIFGYNGLGRLDGQAGGPQAFGGGGPFGGSSGPAAPAERGARRAGRLAARFALVGGDRDPRVDPSAPRDARTGWLIAIGGAFLVTAVAFSFAQGIFHPYYVSLLAPFTAALVGATAAHLLSGDNVAKVVAPLAVAAGVLTEVAVLKNGSGGLDWLPPVLVVVGVLAVGRLSWARRADRAAIGGRARRPPDRAGGVVGADARARDQRHVPRGRLGDCVVRWRRRRSGRRRPRRRGGRCRGAGGPPAALGGGGFGGGIGGDGQSLTQVLSYVKAHGGGTIGVSSQTGASGTIISSGANVVGLGGFSGRESEVSVQWLAQAVKDGQIRWVLTDGTEPAAPGATGASARAR